jgi:hypothetical protein
MSAHLPVAEQISSTSANAVASPSWWRVWAKAVFQPSVKTYEDTANDPNATLRRAFLWVFLGTITGAMIGMVVELLTEPVVAVGSYTDLIGTVFSIVLGAGLGGLLAVLILMISIGATHWFARQLGGTGTYTELAFAFSAFTAPLMLIPFVPYLNSLSRIYGIVLAVIAVKAVHKLKTGNAIAALIASGFSLALALGLLWVSLLVFYLLLAGLWTLINS